MSHSHVVLLFIHKYHAIYLPAFHSEKKKTYARMHVRTNTHTPFDVNQNSSLIFPYPILILTTLHLEHYPPMLTTSPS